MNIPAIFLKYKYWFILSVICSLGAAVIYQHYHSPLYVVSTNILSNEHSPNQSAVLNKSKKALLKVASSRFTNEPYADDLKILPGNSTNSLILKITTSAPQLAKYYLEKLVAAYQNKNNFEQFLTSMNDSLSTINNNISKQIKKAGLLKKQINDLTNNSNAAKKRAEDIKQMLILKAIQPYLVNSDRQFQLIPTTYPINDSRINELIVQFNDAQADKQNLLSDNPKSNINAANNKIIALQDKLTTAISNAESQYQESNHLSSTRLNSKILKDSLIKTQLSINNYMATYTALLQTQVAETVNVEQPEHQKLIYQVIPESNTNVGFYIRALIFGLIIPLLFIYFYISIKTQEI